MKIWTVGQAPPFQMGGFPEFPLVTDVEVDGPYPIGKGFEAYVATAPNGKTVIVEATSQAIVGDSLETVRSDMENAQNPQHQVDHAIRWKQSRELQQTQEVEPEEFWKRLKVMT